MFKFLKNIMNNEEVDLTNDGKSLHRILKTEIKKIDSYFYAEEYHQQYLAVEGSRQYCSAVPTKIKLENFNGLRTRIIISYNRYYNFNSNHVYYFNGDE